MTTALETDLYALLSAIDPLRRFAGELTCYTSEEGFSDAKKKANRKQLETLIKANMTTADAVLKVLKEESDHEHRA